MTTDNEKAPPKPSGRAYDSVDALMRGEGISQDIQSKVKTLRGETKIVLQLAALRQKAGITQEAMGKKLGVSQGAISKLEAGCDEEVTLREIREYARATGQRIGMMFGKPMNHVEAIKIHTFGIKSHLEQLVRISDQHYELQKDINSFLGEAFFNITMSILSVCGDKLQQSEDFEVKLTVHRPDAVQQMESKAATNSAACALA